ncbi:hypothetical protein [Occallatibacter riparius]|uniref:Uncharacterized protein n=1 Tax=Occallatibacter riparius TaxID=1002689 RepID=A0A9J7BP53_9BACT|nr:hypothetical protein [Occallatibacter riparius]UWZ84660.1 hypothetical protein MOP44_01695 [Occallatibacter riparius]
MTTAMEAALSAPVLRCAVLASLEFASETIYVWTGLGDLVWSGMTFKGIGDLSSIEGISEDSNVEAKGVKIGLSGISSERVNDVLFETRLMETAKIWLAAFDESLAIIADPIMIYQGLMDEPEIVDDGITCPVTINLENILVDMNRAINRRLSDEDQQLDLADTLARLGLPSTTVDTGFTHVAGLQEQITFWGRSPSSVNNV